MGNEVKNGVVAGMKWDNKRLVMEEKVWKSWPKYQTPASFTGPTGNS